MELSIAKDRQKLHRLVKENSSQETLKLSDLFKFLLLEKFDREMLQILVKRIEVFQDGNVKVSYNFVV